MQLCIWRNGIALVSTLLTHCTMTAWRLPNAMVSPKLVTRRFSPETVWIDGDDNTQVILTDGDAAPQLNAWGMVTSSCCVAAGFVFRMWKTQ